MIPRFWRSEDCREDMVSTETQNGGDGTISHNHLQQHEEGFDVESVPTPLEEAETTDAWNITD